MSVATPSAPVKPTPPQAPSIGNTDQAAPATDAGAGSNMASPEVVAAVRKLEALGASLQGSPASTQDGAAASKKPSTGKEADAAKPTAKAAGSKQGVQAVSEAGEEQPETAAASQTAAAGLPPKAPSTGGMSSNLPLMVLLLVAVVGIAGWYFFRGRKPARQAEKPLPTGVDRLAGQSDGTEKKKRSGRFEVRI